MLQSFQNTLVEWNRRTSDRQKLQHAYIVLLTAVVFIAGLFSLFNANRSRQLMYIAIALLIGFAMNFLIWSILQTSVLERLPRQQRQKRS